MPPGKVMMVVMVPPVPGAGFRFSSLWFRVLVQGDLRLTTEGGDGGRGGDGDAWFKALGFRDQDFGFGV